MHVESALREANLLADYDFHDIGTAVIHAAPLEAKELPMIRPVSPADPGAGVADG